MATTITNGTDTLTATLHLGYRAARLGRTIVHEILGTNAPAVTLRAAALRTGRRELLFADETIATAAADMLGAGDVITLADTDRPAVFNMTFIVAGTVELELAATTRRNWVLRFDFQEVAP